MLEERGSMDTQIYLRLLFLLEDLVKFLCANLKELHSGKKHLELILSLIVLLFLKVIVMTVLEKMTDL